MTLLRTMMVASALFTPAGILLGSSGCFAAQAGASAAPDVIAPGAAPVFQPIRADAAAPLPAGGYLPAPVPNADANAPASREDAQTQVGPAFYNSPQKFRGDGFSAGSSADAVQQSHDGSAPGLALNVPLD